jgi:hypothetical protein
MADRTSAALFGKIFSLLAKNPTDEHKAIAKEIFSFTSEYDFNYYQMDADNELIILGLAKMGIDPDYPEDGEVVIYAD